jgi:pyrroloquinoline-quinone synthase
MQHHNLIPHLDAMIAERHLLKHPFYQDWTAGRLSLDTLREYAVQYYRHVEAFPRYLSALHSRCDDLRVRQALLANLIEEEYGEDNHPELWLRFAEGLGVARDRVMDASANSATQNLVATYRRLTCEQVAGGLAALYVYEAQIPAVATAKIDGLKRHYGIASERPLAFFTTHESADVYHAKTGAELIRRLAADDESCVAVIAAADEALAALWGMLDGVQSRESIGRNPQ